MALPRNNPNDTPFPFMTCIVKVSTETYSRRGQRSVAKVLNKCDGVHSFRMDDNGTVEISGSIDLNPIAVVRRLARGGRSAELCWFQFGECSHNLFMPPSADAPRSNMPSADGLSAPHNSPVHQPVTDQGYGGYTTGYPAYYGTGDARAHAHAHARYEAVCCTIM